MIRVVAILCVAFGAALRAQTIDTTIRAPEDSVIQRAKQLVTDGRAADGRRLIDSVLNVVPPESERYAEALYWRAALATNASDAERDYRRLIIEAPLSASAEDAFLQLAQLEQARGDRRAASEHLQRFMLTYAKSPARPRVAIWLTRMLFEQGGGPQQVARACEALRSGRAEIPADNAELRNQLEFYAPRCSATEVAVQASTPDSQPAPPPVETRPRPTPKPARDSVRRAPPVARTSAPKATKPAKPAAKTPTEFYSVQLAAYDTREQATNLRKLLVSRGIDARVDGTVRPFRVRVGKYTTRAQATKAAATLKTKGHTGFVTLVKAGPG
jgi:cell division septation protein DedD